MQIATRTEGQRAIIRLSGRFEFSAHREFREAVERVMQLDGIDGSGNRPDGRRLRRQLRPGDAVDGARADQQCQAWAWFWQVRAAWCGKRSTSPTSRSCSSFPECLRPRRGHGPSCAASGASGIRILVADDQRVNQLILEAFLRKEGHTVLVANNGAEAVEMHRTEHPDLVLMDIMMPEMDGLEAARRIGANGGAMRTPLLFLTAINDQQTMIEGLGLGDDFIAKPIDLAILRAKLRAFIRVVQGQRMLREQQQHIERLIDDMRRESEVAAHVMERVLEHTEKPDPDYLQYRVQPSAMFSGDMVLARRTPGGRLHLLLADAVGHGLPAAINILPLFFPFDGMARKGCSLATVARELNRRVRDLLPIDRFIAATLVSIDFASNSFEIWNGGNPPALVLADDGTVIERIDSMQMALGLNDDNPALFEPRHVRCGAPAVATVLRRYLGEPCVLRQWGCGLRDWCIDDGNRAQGNASTPCFARQSMPASPTTFPLLW
jgi:CheY-like chemotaxis protein